MSEPRVTLDMVAPRHRTTTTLTYCLLMVLGWVGLGTFALGLFLGAWVIDRGGEGAAVEIEAMLQCGFGALIAAVSFGLAELAWDVRNRLPERQNLFSQRDT